ncbi:MAG: DUF2169 domain-containing protein [Myxococcales bacterium]|nr:DUF2169 domain-containing protein [Myxococcales bacterium]
MDFLHTGLHPALAFRHRNARGEPRRVVVSRATFDIGPTGELSRCTPQPPLSFREQSFGEVLATPVRHESDIAPEKRKVDVIVNAVAHAPGGRSTTRWDVALRIFAQAGGPGSDKRGAVLLDHRLSVTGPRAFVHAGGNDWRLGEPSPAAQVPLRYDHAYGGTVRVDEDEALPVLLAHDDNPVGCGLIPTPGALERDLGLPGERAAKLCKRWTERTRAVRAPQIERQGSPLSAAHQPLPLAGWGFVAKHWGSRHRHAGTFDDAWRRERHPLLPLDFDALYWNGAHPDLQLDDLPTDAVLELWNVVPPERAQNQMLRIALPSLAPLLRVRDHRFSNEVGIAMRLDTVVVDLLDDRLTLLFRRDIADRPSLDYAHLDFGEAA